MQASLKALLDQVPGSRDALPHMSALERALSVPGGLDGLASVPPKVLTRICGQLSTLPLPRNDPPLMNLLTHLLDLLDRHRIRQPYLSTFVSDSKLMVMEASHTEFDAVANEQATTRPIDI